VIYLPGKPDLQLMLKITAIILQAGWAMQADEDEHWLNDQFAMYVNKYGKSYATDEEWQHRKNLFKKSHKEI
jgi:hypothetical protein